MGKPSALPQDSWRSTIPGRSETGDRPSALLPISPTLPPTERENYRQRVGESQASAFLERQNALLPSHEPPLPEGGKAFHCVPDLSGKDGDAVERVPTGFMAGHKPVRNKGLPMNRTAAGPRPRHDKGALKDPRQCHTWYDGRR